MQETESIWRDIVAWVSGVSAPSEKMKAAQDAFLTVTERNAGNDPKGFAYIDEPTEQNRNVVLLYSNYLKKQKEAEKT